MNFRRLTVWAGALVALGVRAEVPAFERDVKPVVAEYCGACHSAEKQKGELDLMRFGTADKAVAERELWATVAERVTAGEMPPAKSKQMGEADRKKLLDWVNSFASTELDCTKITDAELSKYFRGHVRSRRLNRDEYNRTVRDLVGLDLKPADAFPSDGSGGEGFDNDGDALFVSDMLLEKYLTAARRVVDETMKDPAARKRVIVAEPSAPVPPREAAKRVVGAFARRAYRRPVTDAEVERLLGPFDRATNRGDAFDAAIRLPLQAALISPNFLFLAEAEEGKRGLYRVSDFVLASRLSYFLWTSMPDEELLSLAASGRLHEEGVLRQQVRRMIADPKSRALAERFAIQWLGVDELGTATKPDGGKFREYNRELEAAEKQEVVLFFDAIVREDRSLLECLDADYTFANERLARVYGLDGVKGDQMRRVPLPKDGPRGGVLGMAAVLTRTSYPLRTSPVLRGQWVLASILGGKVPPPPPTAATLPKDDDKKNGKTFRQQLEEHRKRVECAGCHAKMDPLGFGLENFDPMGRWREKVNGDPVDASGVLPSGETFNGPRELRGVLMKRKDEFLRNLSRKMLGYALGRGLTPVDTCVVKDLVTALERDGYKSGTLIESIVMSRSFQYRWGGE